MAMVTICSDFGAQENKVCHCFNCFHLTFHVMHSAYRLNKQGDNTQPWRTAFPICKQCIVPSLVLTVASWLAYKFCRRQVRWLWSSHLFKNFPQFALIHTVKGLTIVNETEVGLFFWNSLAFSMIQQMLAIWSLIPMPFLNPDWTSGRSQFTYCWSLAWRILSITLLACEMSVIVRYFEDSLHCLSLGLE